MSSKDPARLQTEVDEMVAALEAPWRSPLFLEVASISNRHPDRATIKSNLQVQDITLFLGGQQPGFLRLYFDPSKYKTNIPQNNMENGSVAMLTQEEQSHGKKKIILSPAPPDIEETS